MTRFLKLLAAARTGFAFGLVAVLVAATVPHRTQAAGGSKQLQRVRGTVGYSTVADAGDFKQVFAKFDLPDDDFAVTRAKSAAVLALPDSSLVALGENTSVKVSAFDSAVASPGATIRVNGGTLRFEIKRPEGGAANYHFETPTSQVAVRGTIGLLAFVNGITTVGCVVCAADSVAVTVGTQTIALATGQFLAVSAAGAITTGALGSVTAAFSGAGVSVSSTAGAATAGVAGAAAGVIVPAAAAAAAGAAIGIATSQSTAQPSQPTSQPSAAPVVGPTGSVNLTGGARSPQAAPTMAPLTIPSPPAARPTTTPVPGRPPGLPGAPGRTGR
jgi:hypothetical protein